jgi:hypothetical protein
MKRRFLAEEIGEDPNAFGARWDRFGQLVQLPMQRATFGRALIARKSCGKPVEA